MTKLLINDIEIEVIKKNIKNIHLSVHPPDGRVRLAVPTHMDDEAIRLFVISKCPWIKKKQEVFANQEVQSPREYLSGESHYFMGNKYLLNVIEVNEKQRVVLRNNIDLYVRPKHTREKRAKILKEWYRQELKAIIPGYIEKWERIMGVKVNEFGIKLMKTRWGTCNVKDKRIWINLELAKKNPRCLEYIIVHEMVHLLERKHNDRFKTYMDKFLPDWRSIQQELNDKVFDSRQ